MTTVGNFGIGIASPAAKFEINSGTTDVSGLKFTQLTGGSPAGPSSGVVLSVNATGEVILASDQNTTYTGGTGINISGSNVINSLWTNANTSIEATNANTLLSIGTNTGGPKVSTTYSKFTYNPFPPLNHLLNGEYASIYGEAFRSTYSGTSTIYGVKGTSEVNSYDGVATGVYGLGMTTSANVYSIGVYGDALTGWANDYAVYSNGRQFSTSGSFWTTSDERLKTDIKDYSGAIETIKQLNTKTYNYRHDGKFGSINFAKEKQVGFLAQELERVIPEMVSEAPLFFNKHDKDPDNDLTEKYKAVNYTYLIPILTEAIKEQQAQIEMYTRRIEELEARMPTASATTDTRVPVNATSDGWIGQNHPNPFNQQTVIDYGIPPNIQAAIGIYDLNGKEVKMYDLGQNKKGSITIDAGTLLPGMYIYSLLLNGTPTENKKMVISK